MSSRTLRAIAVVSLLFALIPSAASARPIYEPVPEPTVVPADATPIQRQAPSDDADQTLALVIAGVALFVAAGATARTLRVRRVA
jgi:hypothetical protein